MQTIFENNKNDELARIEIKKSEWFRELSAHVGLIYSPDGDWLSPNSASPIACIDDDARCDPKEEIEDPVYEQKFARFIDSAVAAQFCRSSGTGRVNFILQNLSLERARGEMYDENKIFIDREKVCRNPEEERTICDVFGIQGRRALNRLKERAYNPRTTTLQGPSRKRPRSKPNMTPDGSLFAGRSLLQQRMCYFSIARKVFLARIGLPEFLERHVS